MRRAKQAMPKVLLAVSLNIWFGKDYLCGVSVCRVCIPWLMCTLACKIYWKFTYIKFPLLELTFFFISVFSFSFRCAHISLACKLAKLSLFLSTHTHTIFFLLLLVGCRCRRFYFLLVSFFSSKMIFFCLVGFYADVELRFSETKAIFLFVCAMKEMKKEKSENKRKKREKNWHLLLKASEKIRK